MENMAKQDKFIRSNDNLGAVLNTDMDGLRAYKLRKQKITKQENDISQLKNEMSEIKQLLNKILENSSK